MATIKQWEDDLNTKTDHELAKIENALEVLCQKAVEIDKIPEGAVRVHPYNYRNVLRPRGSMKKESLGLDIHERLMSVFEDWTDPKYGDNPDRGTLIAAGRGTLIGDLKRNLDSEVKMAWTKFLEDIRV